MLESLLVCSHGCVLVTNESWWPLQHSWPCPGPGNTWSLSLELTFLPKLDLHGDTSVMGLLCLASLLCLQLASWRILNASLGWQGNH